MQVIYNGHATLSYQQQAADKRYYSQVKFNYPEAVCLGWNPNLFGGVTEWSYRGWKCIQERSILKSFKSFT